MKDVKLRERGESQRNSRQCLALKDGRQRDERAREALLWDRYFSLPPGSRRALMVLARLRRPA